MKIRITLILLLLLIQNLAARDFFYTSLLGEYVIGQKYESVMSSLVIEPIIHESSDSEDIVVLYYPDDDYRIFYKFAPFDETGKKALIAIQIDSLTSSEDTYLGIKLSDSKSVIIEKFGEPLESYSSRFIPHNSKTEILVDFFGYSNFSFSVYEDKIISIKLFGFPSLPEENRMNPYEIIYYYSDSIKPYDWRYLISPRFQLERNGQIYNMDEGFFYVAIDTEHIISESIFGNEKSLIQAIENNHFESPVRVVEHGRQINRLYGKENSFIEFIDFQFFNDNVLLSQIVYK